MEYMTESELLEGKKKVAENVRNSGLYPEESIGEGLGMLIFSIIFLIILFFVSGWVSNIYYKSIIRKILSFILGWIVLIPIAGIPMGITYFFDRLYGNYIKKNFEKSGNREELILNRIKLQEKLYDQVYNLVNSESYSGDRTPGELVKEGKIIKPVLVFEMYKNIRPEFKISD